jgi:hypothetical protein
VELYFSLNTSKWVCGGLVLCCLVLQLYFTQFLENGRRPGPKGHVNSASFRGLKPPAPSGIFDLQL